MQMIMEELRALRAENAVMRSDLTALREENAVMRSDLTALREENAEMRSDIASMASALLEFSRRFARNDSVTSQLPIIMVDFYILRTIKIFYKIINNTVCYAVVILG
jgi:septation ring formation regulator EzrA